MRQMLSLTRLIAGVISLSAIAVTACGSSADAIEPKEDGMANGPSSAGFGGSEPGPIGDQLATDDPTPSPNDQQGQACPSVGVTQKCFVGDPAKAGIGTCTWGTQTCEGSAEFKSWGPCEGSGAPTPAACDGVDHLCNGKPEASCSCKPGAEMRCYTGPRGTENVGTCRAGVQTCNEDGKGWGPCLGEVLPTAEVCGDKRDHSCNGAAGCADAQCANSGACKANPAEREEFCNAAGTFQVTGVRFKATSVFPLSVCSGQAQCGSLTTGGTFTANCAGTYQVCARVPTTDGCEVATPQCVTVVVPQDRATVSLPPIAGFGPTSNRCVSDCFLHRARLSASLDVVGRTQDGVIVSKRDAASSINSTVCILGGDNGGGGNGNF